MTTRPGYIWSGTEWVSIGQEAVVAPVSYQTSAPSSPSTGDIWIDSNDDVPGIDTSQFLRWRKTAAGGETSVSGTDDNGLTLQYTANYEQVYLNGVLLVRGQDYTATNGTSITGLTALAANDVVEVFGVVARVVGDVYTQAQSDDKYSPKTTTGLVLLNTTTFSAVSSVAIDNIFSNAYDNYRIIVNLTAGTATDADVRWYGRSGSPATDTTTNYSSQQVYGYNTVGDGYFETNGRIGDVSNNYANLNLIAFDMFSPNLAKATGLLSTNAGYSNAGTATVRLLSSWQNSTTQFTGIKIYPSSGNITGTIKVYGYK